ncbi:MAG: hypothetical protein HKN41_11560 [Ilumatobacter sp.]|nr:hypothetical protein [Ilumatobacter sp.]
MTASQSAAEDREMGGGERASLPKGAAQLVDQVNGGGHGPVQVDRVHELIPEADSTPDDASPMNGAPGHRLGPRAHRHYEVTVQVGQGRRPMWASVPIPAERLEPGPRSHRFHVVDVNITTGAGREPAVLTVSRDGEQDRGWWFLDRFASQDGSWADDADAARAFMAQNVFAVAARTLALFERVLGRRVRWRNHRSQLFLIPQAFVSANAHYSPSEGAIYFGYLPETDVDSAFHTCLSHDVVTHEVTHAILDGLRPRFLEASLPDQRAFHEAIADIVALLSVLSFEDLLEVFFDPEGTGSIPVATVAGLDELRAADVLGLAVDMGERTGVDARVGALRRSVSRRPDGDDAGWMDDERFNEAHLRGEILVAVVMDTFVRIWDERLEVFRSGRRTVPTDRVCEEGAKAADHLLAMVIRCLDYLPPVEVEFADVFDAIIVADETVAPDDSRNYRGALTKAFEAWGIERPEGRTIDASEHAGDMVYAGINFEQLAASPEEVARWIWHNAHLIDIDLRYRLDVERVYATNRVGPDGLMVREVVAGYTQRIEAPAHDLQRGLPGLDCLDLEPDVEVQLWGGGVIVFDQFGRFRLHQRKPLGDIDRQNRRLEYLVTSRLYDSRGRVGFSLGESAGQEFAALHRYDDRPVW